MAAVASGRRPRIAHEIIMHSTAGPRAMLLTRTDWLVHDSVAMATAGMENTKNAKTSAMGDIHVRRTNMDAQASEPTSAAE